MIQHDAYPAYKTWLEDRPYNVGSPSSYEAFIAGWEAHKEEMSQEAMARD